MPFSSLVLGHSAVSGGGQRGAGAGFTFAHPWLVQISNAYGGRSWLPSTGSSIFGSRQKKRCHPFHRASSARALDFERALERVD